MRPRVLDLYSCQGGAARGYQNAGFLVFGVDMVPQSKYCGEGFCVGDAVGFLLRNAEWIREVFDLIHASPPCQGDSDCQRIMKNEHPDLIVPTREALRLTGRPYVIENVGGAIPKLSDPVELCGSMFGLRTYRHRYFETGGGFSFQPPVHPAHDARQAKMGRAPGPGEFIHAVGNFSGVDLVRQDWGVDWMNRDGIREAIPPAYTEYIGRQFLSQQAADAA